MITMHSFTRLSRMAFAGILLIVVATATACSSGELTAPNRAGSLVSPSATNGVVPLSLTDTSAKLVNTFDLINGEFTLTLTGGSLSGTYTGQASTSSSRRSTASLELDVNGGLDAFQGATGSLHGDGTGAFVGGGDFSLSLDGFISTLAQPEPFRVRAKINGAAAIICEPPTFWVSLTGEGYSVKLGDLTAAFRHAVTNAGCSP